MAEAKQELVRQWLLKAVHDLGTARKAVTEPDPYFDTAVFHLQQAAEKAVKGFLVFHNCPFDRTHDMEELLTLAGGIDLRFKSWLESGHRLTPYAVEFRYPVLHELTRAEYDEALQTAKELFDFVLSTLPPDVNPDNGTKHP